MTAVPDCFRIMELNSQLICVNAYLPAPSQFPSNVADFQVDCQSNASRHEKR